MSQSDSPIWLLDIDGVLNALNDRETLEHPHWTDLVKKTVRTSFDGQYDLVMSTTVVNFVKDQAAAGTDIQWATTWQHDANLFVAPAFGLPVLPVGAEELGMSDYHYKERAALAAIDAGRPLIWTDDDAIRLAVRIEIQESGVPHLLIEPEAHVGLTPGHLTAIAAFLAAHTPAASTTETGTYTTRTLPADVLVDHDANMMYIDIRGEEIPAETKVAKTVTVTANLDFDENGTMLGVEVFLPRRPII